MKKKIFLTAFMIIYLSCSKSSDDSNIYQSITQNQTTPPTTTNSSNTNTSGSSSSSTEASFDRSAMLVFWADQIIIPAHKKFKEDLESLNTSIENFVSNVSEENFDLVKDNWIKAYKSWQHVEMFDIGKSEEIYYASRMNIYPVNIERTDLNISNRVDDIENPNNYSSQGFPTLDYLLHGIALSDSEILNIYLTADDSFEINNYLKYLKLVSNQMLELTNSVIDDWDNSYRDTFISSTENTATSSINMMTNDFIYYYEKRFRANKIGIPAGVFSGGTLPDRVEAYYKRSVSKTLATEALNAITKFFDGVAFDNNSSQTGPSFSDYVDFLETTKNDSPLGDLITDQFEISKTAIGELNDDFTIQLDENKLKMLEAYDKIQAAVVLMKVDMLQALNINVDYVDADGD
ncbi:MAG: peptidase M75 superfamily protein [Flavobacteriales bacterium]|nr:peptidase M75 superfamily protein [Flavobacteriales bacterium]